MNVSLAPNAVAPLCALNRPEREIRLRAFIRYSLQAASNKQVATEMALQLLDRAWEAQKLLWQLQAARLLTEI